MRLLFSSLCTLCILLSCQAQTVANSNDVDIHYQTFGEGIPVLIINGGPGFNSNGFASLANEIAALGYQTVIYDQRGTGKSSLDRIDTSTLTMDLMVEDIEQVRNKLDVEDWVVLGHSFGGMLANYYTSLHPKRVKALILSSSGGLDLSLLSGAQERLNSFFTTDELDSLSTWRGQLRNNENSALRRKYNHLFANAYVYNKEYQLTIGERLMEGNMQINLLLWQNMRNMPFDCKPELQTFTNPVLILQGKNDLIPIELATTAHDLFQNSRLVLLKKCGHYGWLDQKEQYFGAIHDFLADI